MSKATDIRVKNLKQAVIALGGATAFAERYPVDASYVSQILNGHCAFGERAARNMERKCNWVEGALDIKEGQTLINNPTHLRRIIQYDAIGAMGTGVVLQDQAGVIHEWQVSEEWLRHNIKQATSYKNLKIVTGFGDSMKGLFNSGDPLIVDIGINKVDFEGVYFFRVGNEGFIKRLQRIPGQGIKAISENKAYESWTITEEMDVEIFGRVLRVWQGSEC